MKIIKLVPFILLLFTLTAFAATETNSGAIKIKGSVLAPAQEIANFQLTTSKGQAFTKESLKGHWTMMFFGFTNCAMVCPSSLGALSAMYQTLQGHLPADQMPRVVFVTIDPDRDTIARLNSFVSAFNPNFIGARGNTATTTSLEKQLHITADKIIISHEKFSYSFKHSAEVLLFNPEGKLQAYLSYPHEGKQLAKDYQLILNTMSASFQTPPGHASTFALRAAADKPLSPGYKFK